MPVIVESKLRVTLPEVPPPLRFVPATTAVISPVPVPICEPLKNRLPPTLYNLFVVVDGAEPEPSVKEVVADKVAAEIDPELVEFEHEWI